MKLLAYLYRQSGPLMLLAVAAGILSGLTAALLVAMISQAIGQGSMAAAAAPQTGQIVIFLLLVLLHLGSKSGSELLLLQLTQAAIRDLRVDLSRRLLATPQARLQQLGKPGLLVILTKDVDQFTQSFVSLPVSCGNVIIIACCFAYMAWLSLPMFFLLLLFLALGMAGFHYAERKPLRRLDGVRKQMDVLYHHYRELIEGSRELQLNRARGQLFMHRILGREAGVFRDRTLQAMRGYILVLNSGSILFLVAIGLLLFVVPQWLPQPIEVLSALTLTLLYLVRPITELVMSLPVVRNATIALERIASLERDLSGQRSQDGQEAWPQNALLLFDQDWRLELKAMRHHYPSSEDDSQFVLGPIDLTISRGEILFIVGGNGSGKTTLAMVLLGLYRPDEGQISLNGELITAQNIDAYRQNFSAVFADFHLFEDILENNPAQEARAQYYLQRLGLAHKVKLIAGRYSTVQLSSGQRKRLALVTAYLEERPILLFDEWAADQDPQFKRVFYRELLPELKAAGRTVIVISHDDAYFDCADRLLKLADGHRA